MNISIENASVLKETEWGLYIFFALMFCTMGLTSTWFRDRCYKLSLENEKNYASVIKCNVIEK
tara:strand:- start:449 stop:637 length:189 start_codon:yes stop_codon:yes gene_type:complete